MNCTTKVVAELYSRLSLLLIRANARSTLVRSYSQSTQQDSYPCMQLFVCVLCVIIIIIMCDVFVFVCCVISNY